MCLFHFSIGSAAGRLIYHRARPAGARSTTTSRRPTTSWASTRTWPVSATTAGASWPAFAPRTNLALGDSEFNRRSSRRRGTRAPACCPSCSTSRPTGRRPRRWCDGCIDDGRTNLLFVGRIIPNKKIDDLIRDLRPLPAPSEPQEPPAAGRRPPGSREVLRPAAGAGAGAAGTRRSSSPGHVDDDDLRAYYSVADLFLCLSEHEGFCVPLVEAMAFGRAGAGLRRGRGGGDVARRRRAAEREGSGAGGRRSWTPLVRDQDLRRDVLETQARAMANRAGHRLRGAAARAAGARPRRAAPRRPRA